MRIMIVDDEHLNLKLTQYLLRKFDLVNIIGVYTDPRQVLKDIEAMLPDAIFVDIEMPHMNGIELARQIKLLNENVQIVFVTAHSNYALDAFEVEAVHYLLKPLTGESVKMTLNRLSKYQAVMDVQQQSVKNQMRIETFGGFKLYGAEENQLVQWPTKKAQELFLLFVCNHGKAIDKWEICELLWSDAQPRKVEHRLHSTINRLKSALNSAGIENVVKRNKSMYSCELAQFRCDLWSFEQLLSMHPIITIDNISLYEQIIALNAEVWLRGEDYNWLVERREQIQEQYKGILSDMVQYFMEHEQLKSAHHYIKQLLTIDPYNEDIFVRKLELLHKLGNEKELTQAYDRFVLRFRQAMDVDVSDEMKAYYAALL